MRTGKNARTYPTLVRVRKGFLRWEWEPVRDTIVVPPCQNVSHTVSRAETHRIELSVTGCVHQSTGGGREPLATSRLRHSRGRPKKPRPHTGTTRSHTHTLYGKHDRNPVGALLVGGRPHPPFAQILRASSPKDSNASPTNRLRVSLPCGIASS
jgi:hypothetical protein